MKQTVLIADSNFVFAKELSYALESNGKFQVIDIALSGTQTIRMVEERHPDILVMDIMLPEIDGLTVLERIHSVTPFPVVIAYSIFLTHYVTVTAKRLGVRLLLPKPRDPASVAACMCSKY